MWPFNSNKEPIPKTWEVPFYNWSEEQIAAMSSAIRIHNQPDSDGFRVLARIALNVMHSDAVVELVARQMCESSNPGKSNKVNWGGSHYMSHLPMWMAWIEYARPAVMAVAPKR